MAELQRKVDKLVLYENDSEGNRRYDNLRYGSREELIGLIWGAE